MTAGAAIPPSQWGLDWQSVSPTMNPRKKRLLLTTFKSPGGINLAHFFEAFQLIRKGLYPSGLDCASLFSQSQVEGSM